MTMWVDILTYEALHLPEELDQYKLILLWEFEDKD